MTNSTSGRGRFDAPWSSTGLADESKHLRGDRARREIGDRRIRRGRRPRSSNQRGGMPTPDAATAPALWVFSRRQVSSARPRKHLGVEISASGGSTLRMQPRSAGRILFS